MAKQTNNLTGKLAISMIVLLSLLIGPVSVKAGLVCAFGQEARVSDSGYLSGNSVTTYNTISGHNAAIDDTTGIACPENISTYTDLNSCDALITSGLNIQDPNHLITSLTWTMEGATNAQSPSAGVNQIGPYVFNEGTTFVRYHLRDIYGSSNTCMFEVVVADNQSPRFIYSPGNITTSNSQGDCNARVTWSEPVIKDNCVSSGQLVVESNYSPGDIFPVGTTEVVYRVSDGLNEAEHRFNVLVVDNEQPYLVAPNPKVIVCGEEVEDAFTTWEQFEKAGGKTSDNCEVDYESFRYVSQKSSGIRCPYIITRTYSIADISGNVASVNRLIEVTGEEPQINQEEPDESEPVLKSGTEATSVTITLVGKVDVSCYGGTDGSIDIDTTSTNGPITSILWSPGGQTTLDISGLSAGNYSITVTDGDGSNSLNVTIDQPNELNATVSSTDITCNGSDDGTITVSNPTGGYGTYQVSIDGSIWNNISTSSPYTFNNLTPASYTVQIRDVAHPTCTKSLESKTITQPAVLNAVVTPTNVTCNGANDGTITVSNPTGGYGTYQVSINGSTWNNVSTASSYTFNNLSPASYTVQIRDTVYTSCIVNLESKTITQPGALNAVVTSTNVTCNEANNGTITVSSPIGGYGTYEYCLNSGAWQGSGSFANLSPGNYDVQIRDAAYPLCTRSISIVTITQPTQLTATIEITDSILCYNGTASIKIEATGGTSPYTYHFEGKSANTNGIFADIPVGNYDWSVTDANGCTTPVQILTVTQPPQLAATADAPDVTCNGQTTTVTISASGGTSPLSYTLNGVTKTNGTFTGITAGTYTWSVKDANNCTPVSDNITINQPTPITITSANVTTPIPCNGGTGAVTIIATGGTGPLSYTFNGQTNTAGVFTGIYAGTNLSYSVTDANGCGPVFGAIDITQPDAIAATASVTNPISCNGGTATVTIAAAGGTGSISYTFNGVTQSSNVFTGITPGTNIPWSVTDANNCGPVTGTITVSQPSALTASVSETSSITCFGGTAEIRITASGGTGTKTYSFQGQPDNTTGIFAGITGAVAPGTSYTWSVTDANGCMVSGNYAVQQPTPVEITSIGSNSAICQGQTLTLTSTAEGGTGNRTFSWTGPNGFTSNSPNPSITNATPAASGTYTLTVTDANGCSAQATTDAVVHATPTMNIPADIEDCHGTVIPAITLTGAADSYSWEIDDASVGFAASSGTGIIPEFTMVNEGNTPVTATITVTPSITEGCEGLPQIFTITVNPIPELTIVNNTPTICQNGTVNIVLSSNVANTNFIWTGSDGSSGSGAGTELTISRNISSSVTYTIDISANGCSGVQRTETVTVFDQGYNLLTTVSNESPDNIICTGDNFFIDFNGASPSYQTGGSTFIGTNWQWYTRFSWSVNNSNVSLVNSNIDTVLVEPYSGTSDGDAGHISFELVNNTDEDQVVTITITPWAYYRSRSCFIWCGDWSDWSKQCAGASYSRTITVRPFEIICPSDIATTTDPNDCDATLTPDAPVINCDPGTNLTWSMTDGSSGSGNISNYNFETGTTTITYRAQQSPTIYRECSFEVKVNDDELPTINCPASPVTLSALSTECGEYYDFSHIQASDNCAVDQFFQTEGPANNSLFPIGTTTLGFYAEDAAGNSTECSYNVIVLDTISPTITCVGDVIVCAEPLMDYTNIGNGWNATVTDNCSGTTVAYTVDGNPVGNTLNNVLFTVAGSPHTVVAAATDAGGRIKTCGFTVTVNEKPTVSINEGNQSVCSTTGSATFTTAASGTPAPSYQWYKDGSLLSGETGSTFQINPVAETDAGSYTVEVSNSCGAAVSAPAVLTVSTPPVITAQPASQTDCRGNLVEFDVVANQGNTPYSYYWEMRETSASAWIEAATVDNIEFNADSSQLKVYNIGNPDNPNQAQYRVTVTDACENSDTSTIATLTANEVVSADISVSMVCQGEGTTITAITSGATPLSYQWLFYNGTDWVDLTNGGAYSGVTTATLTINNATPAETGDYRFRAIFPINKPNNISATECQRTLATTDAVTFTVDPGPDIVATATPSTICPDENVEIKIYDANGIPGNTFSWSRTNETALPGTFTENTINDTLFISGNINSTSPGTLLTTTFNITGTSPNGCVSTGQVTITIGDDELPNAVCKDITVQLDATGNASIIAADVDDGSTDYCGIATMEVSPSTFDCSNTGGNNVTLTVTDVNGNVATCNATVTVEDTEVPTAVCKDISVELDASGNATIAPADVDNGSSDNCGTPTLSLDITSFDCTQVGDNLVTLTVTDGYSNSATCNAIVTVEDNILPTATCQDIVVQLDATGNATIAPADVDNGSNDNCGITSMNVSPNTFDCSNVGTNTVTLTITDNNGNTSDCTATVTIEDKVDPNVVCKDIAVQLPVSGSISIVAADVDNGSNDNCGIASMDVSPSTFDCSNVGDNTVTLTVTDVNGNVSNCTSTVRVEDVELPVAVCKNISVELDATGNTTITAADIDDGSSDNCGAPNLSISKTTFDCNEVGDNVVTLTVTDGYSNVATCDATVTVEDNILPTAVCQDITVQLDGTGNATIVATDVDDGSSDNCGIASMNVSPNTFDCSNVGSNTVTLTITDDNGNISSCTAIVTIEDNLDPNAICKDITVQLDGAGNATITANDVDDGSNDNCGIASMSVSPSTFDCTNAGDNTVTLTVTDNNGNTSTCTATVTIEDTELPVAVCQNITVQLDALGNVTITPADIDNGSSDNCGAPILSLDKTSFDCTELGANTVVLTATDAAGNSSTCSAVVTVADTDNPVAITATVAQSVIDCYGDLATVTISITGGVGTLTYEFNGVQNGTGVFNNIAAGTNYAWSVTNPLGCGDVSGTFDVIQPDELSASIVATDVTCASNNDGTITITNSQGGSGAYEYTIDGGSNWQASPVFSSLAPGNYDIQIRDANATACVMPISTIEVYTLSADVSHTEVTCFNGSDGTITISNQHGGSNVFQYSINGGSTWENTATYTGLLPGIYDVRIRDANDITCELTLDAALEITQPEILNADLNSTNVSCNGNNDGTITLTNPTGGYGTFEYSVDGGSNWQASGNFSSLSPGFYDVRIRDAANTSCEIILNNTLEITEPPVPDVSDPTDQLVCNNDATTEVVFSGSVSGTTFNWTNDDPSIGLAVSGTGDIPSFTATNPGNTVVTATITITPEITHDGNTCYGNPVSFTITVNPTPDIFATPATQTICDGDDTFIELSSSFAGTTFSWTVVQSGVNGAVNGTGDIINQTLNVLSLTPGTVTYTITPIVGTCSGTPIDVIVTVNPLPTVVATPASPTICSEETTAINLTSNLAGTTFTWTYADSPSGSVTGASDDGGSVIAQTLVNTTPDVITVTYTITPENNGCPGTSITVPVTVNPKPELSSSLTPPDICSASTFDYEPTSATTGTTFTWTRAAKLGITPGASSGTGNPNETLTNISSNPITVTYKYTLTANGCTNTQDVVVTVLPELRLNSTLSSTTCSNSLFTYTPTSILPVNFEWSRADVVGISNPAATGVDGISETLINTTPDPIVVIYEYTLTIGSCVGTQSVSVSVKPTPALSSSLTPPDVCNNTTFTYTPTSLTAGTTFSWYRAAVAGISNTASAGANGINEVLINTTSDPITVRYEYTLRASGCQNLEYVDVVVNPTPKLSSSLTPPGICSNSSFDYTPTSLTVGTSYTWTRAAMGGNPASSGSGDISEVLTAASTFTASYEITLTANGCSNTQNVDVVVNAPPDITVSPDAPVICYGTGQDLTASGAETYVWSPATGLSSTTGTTVTASPLVFTTYTVTGTDINGCVNSTTVDVDVLPEPTITASADVAICRGDSTTLTTGGGVSYSWSPATGLSSTTGASVKASPANTTTYTVTGTDSDGCTSTATVTVTVNALPTINISPSSASICNGDDVTLTASGGISYEWFEDGTSFSTDPQVIVSPEATTIYTVFGTNANGCINSRSVTVTIRPLPILTNANPPDLCSSHLFTFTPTPSISGTIWTWSRAAVPGITPATANGSGNISETLISSNPVSTTITYTFVLNAPNGCSNTVTVDVLVVPAPAVTVSSTNVDLCANESFNLTSSTTELTQTTTLISENFNGSNHPSGWARTQTNATAAWTLRDNGYYYDAPGWGGITFNSNDNSRFYLANSQAAGNNNITSTLRSPQFSTSGYTSATLTFWHYYRDNDNNDQAIVRWSPNGTNGWTNLETYTATEGTRNGFVQKSYSLPVGQNSIYVQFYYEARNDYYWAIDNVTLIGEIAPTVVWSSDPVNPSFGNPTTADVNNVTQTQTTTYTASYTYPGFSCPGQASITITTSPSPIIPDQIVPGICSGSSFTVSPVDGDPGTTVPSGTTYSWSAPAVSGITGTASGTDASEIFGTLNNTSNSIINVVYNVTATAPGGCTWDFTVTVPVNPIPTVNSIANQPAVCSGTNGAAINFVSNVTGATFEWTSTEDVGFGTSGSGNIPAFVKYNNGGAPLTATVSVIATANGCTGPAKTFTVTVNPNQDAKITPNYCPDPPNELKIELNASGGPGPNTYAWSTGANTPTIYVDIADVYSVVVTNAYGCTSTAFSPIANEMVTNGNFEAGNTGFYSGYTYHADQPGLVPAGQGELYDDSGTNGYSVTTSGQNVHVNFWGFDHTSGSGNFMIVNGHGNTIVLWRQGPLTVVPGTKYYFSAYAISLNNAGNYANLQFSINGSTAGLTQTATGVLPSRPENNNPPYNWTRFYGNWVAPAGVTSATIQIVDLVAALSGNDFGLDDISFGTLDPVPGTINPSVDGLVCQNGDIKLLANRTSQKPPFTYSWTGPNGFTSSDENPVISNADPALHNGTYNLTFTDGYGCETLYGSTVVDVNLAPVCSITGDTEVCTNTTGNIYTGPADMVSYDWSITGDGTIGGSSNGQSVSVTAGASCPDSYTVTLTITDATGCSSTCSMEVSSNDTNKPVWTSLAGELDQTVECSDAVGLAAAQALEPTFSDLCSALMGVVKTPGTMTVGSCPNTGTITNSFTVTDVCGNEVEAPFIQIITINDYTDPVWTTAAGLLDQTIPCDDAASLAAAQFLEPVATDNCGAVSYSKSSGDFVQSGCGASGTYTNTWIATDQCGNTTDVFTQVITIVDNSLPTWTTPAGALNVTLQCSDADGLVAAQLLSPEATDNCSAVDAPVKTKGDFVEGITCPQAGTYTNTWTVADVCGNAATDVYTQTITIIDDTKPTWLTPLTALNVYLECSDAAGIAAAQALLPEASDNCDVVLLADKTPEAFVDGAAPCIQAGSYTNTFVAIDDCGNVSETFTQFIFLEDNTPPEVIAPPTAVILCTDNSNDLSLTGTATGSDNCGDVAFTYSDADPVEGSCPGTVTIVRTWTATDDCGNSASATQDIYSQDVTPPVITTPAQDISVPCDGAGNNTDLNNWLEAHAGAVASDDCGSVTWTNDFTVLTTLCGGTVVTFTASDDCGNQSTTQATFTITDDQDPVLTCPAPATATTDLNECFSTSVVLGTPTVTDNCTDPATMTFSNNAPAQYPLGITIVTWTVVDDCGNTATCEQTVTITDNNQAPDIVCPSNVTQTAGPNNCYLNNVIIDPPVFDDNCGVTDLTWTYQDPVDGDVHNSPATGMNYVSGQTFEVGVTTVTYTAADAAGNTATCDFTVTILDITPPVIDLSNCVDVEDDAAPNMCSKVPATLHDPVYSDSCWPDINDLTLSWTMTGATEGSGLGTVTLMAFNVGVTTVEYTVTDPDGNHVSCSFTVTIVDVTPPEIDISSCNDVTDVTTNNNCTHIPGEITDPTFFDTCWPDSTLTLTWEMTGATVRNGSGSVIGQSFNAGVTNVKYIVSDPDGNEDFCEFKVTIIPYNPPQFTTGCPPNIIAAPNDLGLCSANLTIPVPTVDDPCNIGFTITNDRTGTNNASGVYPVGTTEVIWTITPTVGTPTTCTQTITVTDEENPVITSCPVTRTFTGCTTDVITGPVFSDIEAASSYAEFSDAANKGDATDNCGIVAVTYIDVADGTCPVVITRTWTVYDAAGNSATCDQTITIGETTLPVVLCPPDTLQTPTVFDSTFAMLVLPEYSISDNCTDSADIDISWTISGATSGSGTGWIPSPYRFNRGFTNISYTFTDACGNMSTCSFVVFVLYPPEIVCLDSTGTCNDPGDCGNTIEVADLDNPGVPTNVTGEAINWTWTVYDPGGNQIGTGTSTNVVSPTQIGPVVFPIGTSTIHWYAANLSGHDECDQLFTVEDCEAPTFDSNPITNCVDMLYSATYTTGTPNPNIYSDDNLILDPSPDGYTFEAENLTLDISNLDDNCCDPATLIINWRIDFVDTYDPMNFISNPTLISHDPISGTGQPSDYGSDIFFPGDGVTFTTVTHTITYWVTDCNGNVSPEQTEDIIVTPRPELIKVTN